MENRVQILGNKSRSIAGMIAAQTFHIDMNLNPAPPLYFETHGAVLEPGDRMSVSLNRARIIINILLRP
jgi:hypothetical protein